MTNLLERAETRRETFYKLTNSADVPERFERIADVNDNLYVESKSSAGFITIYSEDLRNPSAANERTSDFIPVLANEKYVLQGWVTVPENGYPWHRYHYYDSDKHKVGGAYYFESNTPLAGEQHYTEHITVPNNENISYIRISASLYSDGKLKFEKGDVATDYSQAPEDLGWFSTPLVPTQSQRYLWKFEYIYYSDDSVEVTQPVNLSIAGQNGATGPQGPQGLQGLQGPKGDQGIQGPKGADGKTQYTHIAYADNATGGGFSQTDQNKAYIGMYVDFTATDSTDPTKYKWSKWQGDKGETGAQGVPGPKGTDGKTPYLHIAYANSADGLTDFSTSNTSNKRYLGTYTDYTQSDSADPTKYKWVNMIGTVNVGGRNLIIRSQIQNGYIDANGNLATATTQFTTGFIDGTNNKQFTITAPKFAVGNLEWLRLAKYDANKNFIGRDLISYAKDAKTVKTITLADNVSYFKVSFDGVYGEPFKIERGNVSTDYTTAPEDTQADIDKKADDKITQDQLNALKELSQIQQKQLDAKADLDTLEKWYQEYLEYVNIDKENQEKSEANLIAISERVTKINNDLGDTKERWNFIDTYMDAANEGLVIGKQDGSANIKVSNDRISMFSNGDEVMWITQNMLHIANGVFTKTIQIGKFRFESLDTDGEILGVRYLGG